MSALDIGICDDYLKPLNHTMFLFSPFDKPLLSTFLYFITSIDFDYHYTNMSQINNKMFTHIASRVKAEYLETYGFDVVPKRPDENSKSI